VCTSSAPLSDPSHPYSTPDEALVPTDIDADGDTIAYIYTGQIFVAGTQETVFNSACEWPSIDSAGAYVAFDSAATGQGGVLSGTNVFVLTVSSDSIVCPYQLQSGASANGSATHPFISSNGNTVAFNLSSTRLVWDHSYTYSFGKGALVFAAQCGAASGSNTTLLSVKYTGSAPYAAQGANDACAYNLGTGNLSGAFDSSSTNIAPINHGTLGSGINVFWGY